MTIILTFEPLFVPFLSILHMEIVLEDSANRNFGRQNLRDFCEFELRWANIPVLILHSPSKNSNEALYWLLFQFVTPFKLLRCLNLL